MKAKIVKDLCVSNPILPAAKELIDLGYKIIPCENKVPTSRVKSVNKLRLNPISDKNIAFYIDEATPQIAILTGDQLEAIDVDCKYDLSGKLYILLITAIKYALPDVYDKIIIAQTISKGYHILYKCFQIGGNSTLARRVATVEERAKGERFKVLIETRGEGGYIIASPSPGYNFVKGEPCDIDYITPEERQQLIAICKSFDLTASPELKGVTTGQKRMDNTPWQIFNLDHGYQWMTDELLKAGWTIGKQEDDERVYVLRPGSNNKTSGSIWKKSNILYLFSTSAEFEAEKPYSAFGVLCELKYNGNLKACAKDLAEQGIGTWHFDEGEFHSLDKKGKVVIKYSEILDWMKEVGFLKYRYSTHEYYVVQVLNKIVCISDTDRIKKIFGDYIKDTVDEKVYNHFLPRLASIFSKEGLITQLDELDENKFILSTDKIGWVYFRNAAVKVTSTDINFIEYNSIEGYVWEKNIIKRDFKLFEHSGDVAEFVNLISAKNPEIYLRFQCAFGFLLHKYKDPANPRVIILNDEFFDENNDFEPQGGTGKGLCIKFLSHFRNTYSVDGKRFNFSKNFLYQGLNVDTELMAIEDAAKGFDFEQLFSSITEGFIVEKKGKDEFTIPFDKAPKLLITTNYAIKGSSSSHLRRRYELEVSPFFSHKMRPVDHFGKRFFADWDDAEWSRFDNYMVLCLQLFLQQGLPEQLTINLERKKLIQETNRDFIKWIDKRFENKGMPENKVSKLAFMNEFTEMYPDYGVKLTQGKFTKWLIRWCEYKKIALDASNLYNGVMVYSFREADKNDEIIYEVLKNDGSEKFVKGDQSSLTGWTPVEVEGLDGLL